MAIDNAITQMEQSPASRLRVKLPSTSQIGLILGLAAALALGAGMVMWAMRPAFSPLFTDLAERDVLQVTDELRAQNVPFEIDKATGLILVPNDKLRELRMKLAANGLPHSASLGMEILQQDQRLGTSQFIETARYQHALETELSRTIAAMRNVETARVHLAMPKQSVFVRDRAKRSASVMVKLHPGRTLEDGQIDAIVHLVASSVPYMESPQVTVVDQWGHLLTSNDPKNGLKQTQQEFEYARKLEQTYEQRIQDLLTPIVGRGAIKAKVSAELDFSQNERTEENFEPDPGQVRSEQIQDQQTRGQSAATGVPGALSNQPPGSGTTDPTPDGQQGQPLNSNKSSTRNYELDKTITHTRLAAGTVKRLSIAVLVDDRVSVDEKGETIREPLNDQDLELLTALVREAVGFNEQRGDSLVVRNRSFQPMEAIEPLPDLPIWEQPWFMGLAKQVLAGLTILFILLGIVRPAIRSVTSKNAIEDKSNDEGLGDEVKEDKLTLSTRENEQLPAPSKVYGDILNMARAMAAEDPKRVAIVVKNWVAADV